MAAGTPEPVPPDGRAGAARRTLRRWGGLALAAGVVCGVGRVAAAAPAITIESSRFGHTFVAGATPELILRVTPDGKAVRGTLAVVARDGYGGSAGRARFRIDVAAGETWRAGFTLDTRRLGHFTVRATLAAEPGRTRVTASATAGIVPPPPASDAEASAVGYYVLPSRSELPWADAIAAQMRLFGIRWVRLAFDWLDDARLLRPDTRDPRWLDTAVFEAWVDAFRRHDIEVLGVIFGTARWASSQPRNETVDNTRVPYPVWGLVAPDSIEDWRLFVGMLAARLRGRVGSWELWNEPDSVYFWRSGADEFATLVRATAAALRAVDPGMRLAVNFVDRDAPASVAFQERVLALAGDELDVLGWHYGDAETVAAARALLPNLRPGAAIWNTEAYGVPRRLISRWLQLRAAGTERLFPFIYHTIHDDAALGLIRFGLYPVNLDYTPRPDAIALRTLSDLVGSAAPAGAEAVGLGYSAYTFAAADGPVVALVDGNDPGFTWMPASAPRIALRLPDGVGGIEIIDLMGNRRVRRVAGGRLQLSMAGVATFLRAVPARRLDGLRVVGSRMPRGPIGSRAGRR